MTRRTWLAALSAAIAGFALGMFWPESSPAPSAADEDRWQPIDQAMLARFDESAFLAARNLRWGGESGAASDDEGTAASWLLVGIVRDPQPVALVTAAGSAKVERLAVGSAVPDGGTLAEIGADRIVIERDGCRWSRRLYSNDPVPDTSGGPTCGAQAAPTPTRELNDEA